MKDNWIKVSDRLPENVAYVLVRFSDGDYAKAWYSQNKHQWYWNTLDEIDNIRYQITHWQPLEGPEK